MKAGLKACLIATIILMPAGPGMAASKWRTIETDTHRFTEVAPGAFLAAGTGRVSVFANSFVIVNESDTLVVDSHVSPRAAEALLASIKAITDKPVRFLVNTHFHHDHVHGNQAFPDDVLIIGHESARDNLLNVGRKDITYVRYVERMKGQYERMAGLIAKETDPEKRAHLEQVRSKLKNIITEVDEVEPVPPNVTFERKMVLYRGDRVIQLLCFGRGHTGGDILVYLPKEKVLFTGDFLLHGPAYMADCYVDEWIGALEELKKLDFDLIVPGHGEPFSDRRFIDAQQRLLQSVWDQLATFRKMGIPPEEAIGKVDLTEELAFYTEPIPGHMYELDPGIAIRVYERLEQME